MRASRGKLIVGGAVIALLALAPSAQAAFSVTNAAAVPASTSAGANANLTLSFDTPDTAEDIEGLTIHLPPGLIGNPLATPKCSVAELEADSCDPGTRVGTVQNQITVRVVLLDVPLTVNGDVYNLTPQPGEPARFGIVLRPLSNPPIPNLLPPIILQSGASLRPSDLGLDTVLNDLPNMSTGLPVHIQSTSLTLFGRAGAANNGFIRLPTSCKTHTVGFDAVSHDGDPASAQAQFTTDNCGALPFTPELSARVKRVGPISDPVELSTTIAQTIDEAGLLRAQVTLPQALGGGASALTNVCPGSAFAAGNCPPASVVGEAIATSPLLAQSLSGPVAMVEPPSPGLPELGVDLRGPLALKLRGQLALTPAGNVVTFDGLPDIPISTFTLTFRGGPGGLVSANRDICQPPPLVFNAGFLSHSGASTSTTATAEVDCSDATGGGNNGANRKPRAKVKLGRLGSDEPRMKLTVKAGSERLRSASLRLPRELRFAAGKAFDRGTSVAKVTAAHSPRRLKLKAKPTARKLVAEVEDGALEARKGLRRGERPRFKLVVRDAEGKRTKLTVRGQ